MLLTRNTLLSCLLPFLLLLPVPVTLAEEEEETRWYEVEVLFFVQQSQDYRKSEYWPADYSEPPIEESRELETGEHGTQMAFRRLSETELQRRADAERIRRAPDLELLAHFGWLQPGMAPDKAIPVRISDEMFNLSALETAEGNQPRLSGTLKLMLARYLHIEANLLYRETIEADFIPSSPDSLRSNETASQVNPAMTDQDSYLLVRQDEMQQQPLYRVYQLQESRRMRSEELHYLDHPVFGMAIQIRPYKVSPQSD